MLLGRLARSLGSAAVPWAASQLRLQGGAPAAAAAARELHHGGAVGLTPEQQDIHELAMDFAKERLMPKASEWDAQKIFPVHVMREAAQLGFAGLYVPEQYGGSGLGRLDGALVFEGLAYGDVSTAAYLSITNMVANAVAKFGSEEAKARFLPSLCSLERLGSYCLTEPGSGSDAASLATTAAPVEGGWLLSGSKAFISGAGVSDLYLVMARCHEVPAEAAAAAAVAAADAPDAAAAAAAAAAGGGGGAAGGGPGAGAPGAITAFLVEKGASGLSFGAPERKMGWRSQPTAAVNLDRVFVPHWAVLGAVGSGFRIAMQALDGGRVNIGACSVGGAAFCLDYAWRYASERRQFGRPVGAFQATQFKLADMATSLEASRALVRGAAAALDAGSARATLASAMAKRFATDACFGVANDALQVLGGYGYLEDHAVERCVRDLRVHSILEGTNEIMRVIIHRQLSKLDFHHLD